MFPYGTDETCEQWMSVTRIRSEFGVKLTGEEKRMVYDFHHFDEIVDRQPAEIQAGLRQLLALIIVDFVAMPVAFHDLSTTVTLRRQ